MADLLTNAALWVVQLLLDLLPDSWLTGWLAGMASNLAWVSMGLQALNWLFDVNGMLIVLGLWLVAAEAYMIAWFGVSTFNKLRSVIANLIYTGGAWKGLFGL